MSAKIIGITGDFGVGKSYMVNLLRREIFKPPYLISFNLQDAISLRLLAIQLPPEAKKDLIFLDNFIGSLINDLKLSHLFIKNYVESISYFSPGQYLDNIYIIDFLIQIVNELGLYEIYNQKVLPLLDANSTIFQKYNSRMQEINKLLEFYKQDIANKNTLMTLTREVINFLIELEFYEDLRFKLLEKEYDKLIKIAEISGVKYIIQYIYSRTEYDFLKQKGVKIIYVENPRGTHLSILASNIEDFYKDTKEKLLNDPAYREKQEYFKRSADAVIKNELDSDLDLIKKVITAIQMFEKN